MAMNVTKHVAVDPVTIWCVDKLFVLFSFYCLGVFQFSWILKFHST